MTTVVQVAFSHTHRHCTPPPVGRSVYMDFKGVGRSIIQSLWQVLNADDLIAVVSPGARQTGACTVLSAEATWTDAQPGGRVALMTSATPTSLLTLVAIVTTRTRTITRHATPPASTDTSTTHVVARGAVITSAVLTTSNTERSLGTLYKTSSVTYHTLSSQPAYEVPQFWWWYVMYKIMGRSKCRSKLLCLSYCCCLI